MSDHPSPSPQFGIHASASPSASRRDGCRGLKIWVLLLVILIPLGGCSRLRLPAVDPTGQKIFSPLPTTTGLALPDFGHAGHKHKLFHKFGDPLNLNPFSIPEPAFVEPAAPPECLTPLPATSVPPQTSVGGASTEPCVPSAPCPGDCKDGPPAVLLGNECHMKDLCHLPERGKRGCILLSPQKIVAPVGGEVVLLSGICGTDGYLQMGEPLEWMLTPDSVGTFIEVGNDDPGLLHKLARVKKASKQDPSYAFGVTSTKRAKITRGNMNPGDDVQLEKGQTWLTISSPSEGTSRVTVLAPESECWDQRKATATIYWVDARWQYPGTQIVPAGTPVELNTRVTRAEGTLPARGWKVRYEIMQPDLATFAGTGGSSYVEATVDDGGNATVQLVPTPGTAGTATINMQIIRPGGETDNIPTLTLSQGQTFVRWSSPQLALRAGAPAVATYGSPVQVVANVSNPGDQPANNVRVTMQIPSRVQASSPDSFATNTPGAIVWEIGTIPPQTQLDLFANVTTESPMRLTFEARGEGELFATDTVAIDVYRPSLVLSVSPEQERYEVGDAVTYNIDVRNTGDRPLENVQLVATGDSGMLHESNERTVRKPKTDGPLQPGAVWPVAVTFIATDPGRRCIDVEATADAGQRATSESCVTVINRPVPTPAVTATLNGRAQTSVGATPLFRGVVGNTGQVPLQNVKVVMVYDAQLKPLGATEDFLGNVEPGRYLVQWTIPRLDPGNSQVLEAQFEAIGTSPRSTVVMTVESDEGARASQRLEFEILPGAAVQPPPSQPDALPPAMPPPRIPSGPAPIPTPEQPATPPPAAPEPEPQALDLNLTGPTAPVSANQPIRYRLAVTNPSQTPDSVVSIRFNLPSGVQIQRITQQRSPELGSFEVNAGQVYLADIRSMRPGETITYEIVLVSNQPQTFDLQVEAVSRGKPLGARAVIRTVVSP
ncbi:DUF7507 domain-containing protein [Roseiconus nitratireducens]|nr:hypothetical protein [Roseiconus nitratireducens]